MILSRRLTRASRVVLATHNLGKIAELRPLLERAGLEVTDAIALGLAEPAETADDFSGNARAKALAAARACLLPAVADDSGFAVTALNGAPGLRSARWAAEMGGYDAAMRTIHDQASFSADRRASFVCVLAAAWPDGNVAEWRGEINGNWTWPPRGSRGFGYDPMFVPNASRLTFAEMEPGEKAACSHRARALAAFAADCLP